MLRNRWLDYSGLGGRIRPESPAGFDRKTHNVGTACELPILPNENATHIRT